MKVVGVLHREESKHSLLYVNQWLPVVLFVYHDSVDEQEKWAVSSFLRMKKKNVPLCVSEWEVTKRRIERAMSNQIFAHSFFLARNLSWVYYWEKSPSPPLNSKHFKYFKQIYYLNALLYLNTGQTKRNLLRNTWFR